MAERRVFSGMRPEGDSKTIFNEETNSFVTLVGKDYEDHLTKLEKANKEKRESSSKIEEDALRIKKEYPTIFKKQLTEFRDSTDYREKYKPVDIKGMNYLIEVFKYRVKDGQIKETPDGKKFQLFDIHPLTGDIVTLNELSVDYTHIAKILKVGNGFTGVDTYKEGDLVFLNPYETTKMSYNPDWLALQQYQFSQGMDPIVPDDIREKIPSIQARFTEYQFVMPEDYKLATQDIVTFLIPEHKVKAKYNI